MAKISKLLHTRYRVNDLEKTISFYCNILGLQEVRRSRSARGSELVFLKAPQSEELIEICHFPQSGSVSVQEDLTHLAFQVDDLEEFAREIEAKGWKLSDPISRNAKGVAIAFIDAPEGYEIELIEKSKTI
jgi:lactoylglutathione lyase